MDTISVEGHTLKAAIVQACEELEIGERGLRYRIDTDHFRDSFGRARGVDTVRIIAWKDETVSDEPEETESSAEGEEAQAAPEKKRSSRGRKPRREKREREPEADEGEEAEASGSPWSPELVEGFIGEVLGHLGIENTISSELDDDRLTVQVELGDSENEYTGGQRKQVLSSLDYLANRLSSAERGRSPRVSLSRGNDERAAKERSLKAVATKVAEQVTRKAKPLTLKPMNSYERRIIHLAIAKIPGVDSRSLGEGQRKRVEVFPDPEHDED